jgi:hypothetical protein
MQEEFTQLKDKLYYREQELAKNSYELSNLKELQE